MNHQQIVALVKLYSKDMGLTVNIGGDTAFTTGTTTNIPGFTSLPDEMIDVLMGYIAHESEHNKSTDFNIKGANQKPYFNLFEDHRIERLAQTSFPGFKTWFQKLDSHLYSPKNYEDFQSMSDSELINDYLVYQGSIITMDRSLDVETMKHLSSIVSARLGHNVCSLLDDFLKNSKTTTSSMDCIKLSDLLEKALVAYNPPKNSESASDSENDDVNSESAIDSENDDTNQQRNAVSQLIEKITDKTVLILDELNIIAGEQNTIQTVSTTGFSPNNAFDKNDLALQELIAQTETHNVRRALAHILQDKQRKQQVSSKSGNKLYGSKLHRAAINNPYIFKKNKSPKISDYDFTVLLDTSLSMQEVMSPVLTVTHALISGIKDNKNCSLAFSTFPDKGTRITRGAWFDKDILSSIYADGGTPIVQSFSGAISEIENSSNKKIILTITDLDISQSTADEINNLMRKSPGINYVWVGINTKFEFPLCGHVIDSIDAATFASTLKTLANKLVA